MRTVIPWLEYLAQTSNDDPKESHKEYIGTTGLPKGGNTYGNREIVVVLRRRISVSTIRIRIDIWKFQ